MNFLKQIHWSAVGGWITTLAGVAVSPAVLGLVSPHTAAVLVVAGSAVQAFTKPVPKPAPSDSTAESPLPSSPTPTGE